MIRNRCNIFGLMDPLKNGGKLMHDARRVFPSVFRVDTSITPQNITMIPKLNTENKLMQQK